MSILALTSCLGLALLAAVDASAQTGDSAAAVALARETLARKMHEDPAAFDLASVEASRIRLAGTALRCEPPEEDEAETVAGWRVRLVQGQDTYDLVVAEGQARMCNINSSERAAPPARLTIESELASEVDAAREDLARRLSIRPETIKVVEAVSVVWRDSSVGCPEKGMDYLQVLTPGFRIRLNLGGRPYLYHGRDAGTPFLCGRPSGPDPLPAATS